MTKPTDAEKLASEYELKKYTSGDYGQLYDAYLAGFAAASARAEGLVRALEAKVNEQANDDGLWSVPWEGLQPIAEAYLQQELRALHVAIEEALAAYRGKDE